MLHRHPKRATWQHGQRNYSLYSSDSEHSREKTLVLPRLRQFSVHKLSCQMNFVKKFSKTLHVSTPSLPRHNSNTDLPSKLPAELLSTPLVWVHRGGLVPPLQPHYGGLYAVLRRSPRSFTIRVRSREEVVAVSHGARHGSRRHAWQPALTRQTAGLAPRWSYCNQAGLVFRPAGIFTFLFCGAATQTVQEPFSW
jgi:hypothetical protein